MLGHARIEQGDLPSLPHWHTKADAVQPQITDSPSLKSIASDARKFYSPPNMRDVTF
jgi:hypothetical protein